MTITQVEAIVLRNTFLNFADRIPHCGDEECSSCNKNKQDKERGMAVINKLLKETNG